MRVFVTGGTGFVGRQIIRDLLAAGHEVTALVRRGSESKLPVPPGQLSVVQGDILQPETFRSALKDCQAVIHLVGIIRAFPWKGIRFQDLHVQATANVLLAAQEAGIARMLHMSALGVGRGIETAYLRTKLLAERLVQQSSLEATIFRPATMFGPEDNFVNRFARMIRHPLMPFVPVIGKGEYRLQPVAVENVSQGFIRALEEPKSIGKIYEVAGPEQLSMNELLRLIRHAVGKDWKPLLHLPIPLLRVLAGLLDWLPFFPFDRDQITMLQAGNTTDSWKAFFREFGITPIALRDAIPDLYR